MLVTPTLPSTRPESTFVHAPRTRKERRNVAIISGVWLIFLSWTVIELLNSTAPLYVLVPAWIALVAFPPIHLAGFLYPQPLSRLNRHANTLAYTLALVALGIVMAQAVPTAIINVAPYLMSQWIFNHRLRTGLLATGLTIAGAIGIVMVRDLPGHEAWLLPSVFVPGLIMVFARFTIEMEAQQQHRSEQFALAQQRQDLASTVHDVLGHSLTTITVKVQLAQRLIDTDLGAAKAELAEIEALARRSLSEVRASVTDLQHPDLTEQLNSAQRAFHAANITLHQPEPLPKLGLLQQQVFVWVIREAITNVLRHAHAATCTITIGEVGQQQRLRIDDDGVGMTDPDPKNHHGLAGLHRRVTNAGGTLELFNLTPGTRLEVIL